MQIVSQKIKSDVNNKCVWYFYRFAWILRSSSELPQSSDVKVHKIKLKVVFYKKRVSERKKWNVEKHEAEKADKIKGNISKYTCSMNRHKLGKFNLKCYSWKCTNTFEYISGSVSENSCSVKKAPKSHFWKFSKHLKERIHFQ